LKRRVIEAFLEVLYSTKKEPAMTHQADCPVLDHVMTLLIDDRQGFANGFKPKTIRTRVGEVPLRIPQTRGYHDEDGRPFYPKSLERGVRSERAMILAVAEMYCQHPKGHGHRGEALWPRGHFDPGQPSCRLTRRGTRSLAEPAHR
jgi:transposase-like protein